ncbi:MFS transporter [Actinoalloteichus spitiensis]|uniref:MFS transporter n=1 Tax=Actinoalloteichus spitiensis TaxID=252394 RepID=UPI00068C3FAB|nr:MFS transporter [Actinoalloteichus spitiensis]
MSGAVEPAIREVGPVPRAGARQWGALAVLMLPVLLVAVDNTVLSFAVPALSLELAPSGTQLLWIVDIYSLMLAGLLVTMGGLGDRLGRRRLLLVGGAGFGLVSILAAYATSPDLLVAARALLGVFGATLMPSTLSLLRSTFLDPGQRRLAIAVWSSAFAGGAALGPILGGWLLEHFWWGSVFLVNVPVMVLLLVLGPLLLPESRDPAPGPFDLVSVGLSLAAMLPVVYGVKALAKTGASPEALVPLAVGALFAVLFTRRQLNRPKPLLDLRLFRERMFSVAVTSNLLSVLALVGFLFFVSQYLQLVLGLSPVEAGVRLLPGLLAQVVAALLAVLLARHIRVPVLISAGLLAAACGYVIAVGLPVDGGAAQLVVAFAVLGAGVGLAETLTNDAIVGAVPPARAGGAAAISETAYELGAALGTAVLGSVLIAVYQRDLVIPAGVPGEAAGAARETIAGAESAAAGLPAELAAVLMDNARAAFVQGMSVTSAIGVAIMAVAGIGAAVLLRRRRS